MGDFRRFASLINQSRVTYEAYVVSMTSIRPQVDSAVGIDIRDVIAALNPILRGWGNYFRTGNAADKFTQIDRYVTWRLKRLLIKKRGRNLRAGQADQWTTAWFKEHGLHQLSGTIRYPKAA